MWCWHINKSLWCRMSRKIAKFTITAFFRVHFSSIMGQQLHSFLTNPLQLDNWLYFNKMFLIQCFCIHPLTKSTLKHLHMNIWATKGVIIQHIIFPICHIHKLLHTHSTLDLSTCKQGLDGVIVGNNKEIIAWHHPVLRWEKVIQFLSRMTFPGLL